MNVNNQSWNCSKLRFTSRIMAHDRHEGESSCLDEWRMKNMSRFCSPASHAFVLSIVHGIYTRDKDTRTELKSVVFSCFAHVNEHTYSQKNLQVKHFSSILYVHLRTLPSAVRATDV